jgi:hypothetical protein
MIFNRSNYKRLGHPKTKCNMTDNPGDPFVKDMVYYVESICYTEKYRLKSNFNP